MRSAVGISGLPAGEDVKIVLDCKVADLLDVGPDLTRKGVNHHV